jgi:hypothetical protein
VSIFINSTLTALFKTTTTLFNSTTTKQTRKEAITTSMFFLLWLLLHIHHLHKSIYLLEVEVVVAVGSIVVVVD